MSEKKFSVIRSWEVEAETTSEAIEKTKNWVPICVNTKRISNFRSIAPPAENSIPVGNILKEVLKCLKLVQQRYESKKFYPADTYLTQATALIELVELYDCGHTGGFGDRKYMLYSDIYHNVFARFLWLHEKYISGETPDLPSSEISGEMSDFWKS